MPKFLIRIVAVLLIPWLIVDPSFAKTLDQQNTAPHVAAFTQEALSLPVVSNHRYLKLGALIASAGVGGFVGRYVAPGSWNPYLVFAISGAITAAFGAWLLYVHHIRVESRKRFEGILKQYYTTSSPEGLSQITSQVQSTLRSMNQTEVLALDREFNRFTLHIVRHPEEWLNGSIKSLEQVQELLRFFMSVCEQCVASFSEMSSIAVFRRFVSDMSFYLLDTVEFVVSFWYPRKIVRSPKTVGTKTPVKPTTFNFKVDPRTYLLPRQQGTELFRVQSANSFQVHSIREGQDAIIGSFSHKYLVRNDVESMAAARFFYSKDWPVPISSCHLIVFTLQGDPTPYILGIAYDKLNDPAIYITLLWPDQKVLDAYLADLAPVIVGIKGPTAKAIVEHPGIGIALAEPRTWHPEGLKNASLESTEHGFRLIVGWDTATTPDSSGPSSAGQNLAKVLPGMLSPSGQESIGHDLWDIARNYEDALPHTLSRLVRALWENRDIEGALAAKFGLWLHHLESELGEHYGYLMSWLVRYQLRLRSRHLTIERKRVVADQVMGWAKGQGLNANVAVSEGVAIASIELPLQFADTIDLRAELVDHESSYLDANNFNDGLILPLGRVNFFRNFAILLQDRACATQGGTLSTIQHEVWETGLRALGYSADIAHEMANRYIREGRNIKFLKDHPRNPNQIHTSGPSASGSNAPRSHDGKEGEPKSFQLSGRRIAFIKDLTTLLKGANPLDAAKHSAVPFKMLDVGALAKKHNLELTDIRSGLLQTGLFSEEFSVPILNGDRMNHSYRAPEDTLIIPSDMSQGAYDRRVEAIRVAGYRWAGEACAVGQPSNQRVWIDATVSAMQKYYGTTRIEIVRSYLESAIHGQTYGVYGERGIAIPIPFDPKMQNHEALRFESEVRDALYFMYGIMLQEAPLDEETRRNLRLIDTKVIGPVLMVILDPAVQRLGWKLTISPIADSTVVNPIRIVIDIGATDQKYQFYISRFDHGGDPSYTVGYDSKGSNSSGGSGDSPDVLNWRAMSMLTTIKKLPSFPKESPAAAAESKRPIKLNSHWIMGVAIAVFGILWWLFGPSTIPVYAASIGTTLTPTHILWVLGTWAGSILGGLKLYTAYFHLYQAFEYRKTNEDTLSDALQNVNKFKGVLEGKLTDADRGLFRRVAEDFAISQQDLEQQLGRNLDNIEEAYLNALRRAYVYAYSKRYLNRASQIGFLALIVGYTCSNYLPQPEVGNLLFWITVGGFFFVGHAHKPIPWAGIPRKLPRWLSWVITACIVLPLVFFWVFGLTHVIHSAILIAPSTSRLTLMAFIWGKPARSEIQDHSAILHAA